MRFRAIVALASTSVLALSNSAFAQSANSSDDDDEIVVTGTLLRGVSPVGSQTIGVDTDKIESIGAVTTSDLIGNIPQAGAFLGFVGVRGSSNFSLAVNRPSLRYLGSTSASGATTLLLVDGHRMPGMGITQSSPDLDSIAPGAIERVDIVTDGGSSTYGSDAIGGVMNFITRKEFEGVEVKGSVGFADELTTYNAGLTVGKTFGNVNAYVSYDYSKHDSLYGGDRDWSQSRDWVNNLPSNSDCAPGSLRIGSTFYALPALGAGLGNRCDNSELTTIYPRETKHSVFGSIHIDTGGPVTASLKMYYVQRENASDGGPLFIAGGSTVRSVVAGANQPTLGAAALLSALPGAPTSGQLLYNFSPVLGNSSNQVTNMKSWGFTPSIKVDVSDKWQLNAMFNYGVGKNDFIGQLLNGTPITAAINAGTFNPFNLAAAGNAAAITSALDWFQMGRARHETINARAILDGPLFALGGGDVRAAIGVEYLTENYQGNNSRSINAAGIAALSDRSATRRVHSVFGELNVPLISPGGGMFHSLSINASGRYDKYSDFGGTFNPKIGVNFEPVDWMNIRGNWGEAFQAPGISDIALGGQPSWNILPLSVRPFSNPAVPPTATRTLLLTLGGTITPLEPQTAKTWSLGFDIKPPVIEGLALGMTYYNIDYKGVIGFPPIFDPPTFYRDFPNNNVIYTAGDPALLAYFNTLTAQGAPNAATTLANIGGNMSAVYGVLDSRTQNLARVKTSGIDFYARYRHETGFGAVFFDVNGTRILNFQNQSSPTAALVDAMPFGFTNLRVSSSVGADIGNLRTQMTWNHSGGLRLIPVASTLNQDKVSAYNVFNLFMQYKVPGDSVIAKDLVFALNIDNLFDKDPPLYRGADASLFGVRNGFTLGRLVRIGLSKKF